MPLETKALQFKPLCGLKNPTTAVIGDSGTTYDEAFADLLTNQVKIPIGFAIIQNFMSSFTYSLMKVTGCTDSLQSIQGDLVSTYLPQNIRKQALDFHRQCFIEARTKFNSEKHEASELDPMLKRYGGEDDLNWMGSKILQKMYYSKLHARQPVPGFTFHQALIAILKKRPTVAIFHQNNCQKTVIPAVNNGGIRSKQIWLMFLTKPVFLIST